MSSSIKRDISVLLEPGASRWKQQIWYIPTLGLAMGMMMVRPLLMARLLDVQGFAHYSAGLLVSSTFCMLGCIGLQSLLQRDMPGQLMRNRELAAAILLMQCLMVALICAALGLVLSSIELEVAGINRSMLAISILHGLAQQVFLLATVESRSRGQPLRFSQQQLLRAILVLASGSVAAVSLESVMAVLLVETVVSLLLSWKMLAGIWRKQTVSFSIICCLAVSRLGRIPWRSAVALFAVMIAGFSLLNVDRWLAASLLSSVVFAQYAFAWVMLMVAQSAQAIVNTSIFPLLARRFAINGKLACFRVAARTSIILLVMGAIAAWPTLWVIDAVIFHWYPDYTSATSLLSYFIWVAVLRVSDFWSSYLIVVGYEKRLLSVNLLVASLVSAIWLHQVEPWVSGNLQPINLAVLVILLTAANYGAVFSMAYISTR